jgi:hypothetical protein
MSKLARLVAAYRSHVGTPWQPGLAGPQRGIFAVYDKTDELKLRAQVEEFAIATRDAGYRWQLIDVTDAFPHWMAQHRYREDYFEAPDLLEGLVGGEVDEFTTALVDQVRTEIRNGSDERTVWAIIGVGALFGIARVAKLVEAVAQSVPGRLLVLFPGEYADNRYRLLDARPGWDYLAVPLVAEER